MKKIIFSLIALCIYSFTNSQITVLNPKTGMNRGASYLQITKIVCSDTATSISFDVTFKPRNWISIPKKTYIQVIGSDEKLYVKNASGIEISKRFTMPESGKTSYTLNFPPIDKKAKAIDYGEDNDGGSWFIYDIQLQKTPGRLGKLAGNWFSTKSGDWELSLFDNIAIYQSKIWKYTQLQLKKNKGEILLQNGNETKKLYLNLQNDTILAIGESLNSLKKFTSKKHKLPPTPGTDFAYKAPVFSYDSAIYCGYIPNYTPRIGVKTIGLSVDNVITGNQNAFMANINEDGTFYTKIPVLYPQFIYIRSEIYNGSIFLEPGKTVFQLLQPDMQYMGESGRVNADLVQLMKFNRFDYDKTMQIVLDMDFTQFKNYYLDLQAKDYEDIDSLEALGVFSEKAMQIARKQIEFRYPEFIIFYDYFFESAYRKKNKITDRKAKLPIEIPQVMAKDIDFISQDMFSNPLNVISNDFNSFLNRLMYSDPLRKNISNSFTTKLSDIVDYLDKSGYQFTSSEKNTIKLANKVDSLFNLPVTQNFITQNAPKFQAFNQKFKDTIQTYKKQYPNGDNSDLEKYFKTKKIKLTKADKETFKLLKEYDKMEYSVFFTEYYSSHTLDSANALYSKHNDVHKKIYRLKYADAIIKNIRDSISIDAGLVGDLIVSQSFSDNIVDQMQPYTDEDMTMVKARIFNPFIAGYMDFCNDQTKAKIEENKKKTGYTLNDTPKTEADKIFETIMQKYRGKVIYVDFWATWCGPCRSGIEKIKPLKEEMDSAKVAFVYITNESSPLETWKNMIPDIKGEHYRLKQDEWNYLSSKFNLTGIPHYVLVGQDGNVINPALKFLSNSEIKQLLEKYMKE